MNMLETENVDLMKRRILIIDDNPSIHEDYQKILVGQSDSMEIDAEMSEFFGESLPPEPKSQSLQTLQVASAFQGQEGVDMVSAAISQGNPFAMAFVDMRMPPGWDGLKTIEEVWKVAPDLQVVICTAYSDNTWEEVSQRLGQKDNLLILKKPFDSVEVFQLAVALTEKWDLAKKARLTQQELEQLVEERTAQLQQAALHDPLTNLANRNKFNDRLDAALKRCKRGDIGAGVILIDVDFFKQINDTKGHAVGDQLLVQVAQRLTECVRETDTVARLGGDEFAIIQSEVKEPESARIVLERIHNAISQPYQLDGEDYHCGFSVGIAMAPTDGIEAEDLLQKADLALYQAKEDGRGIFRFYDTDIEARVRKTREVEKGLHRAIAEKEFELYYQPIISTETQETCGMEALIRWIHPQHGLISPADFIPVAEKTRLIIPLGQWVIQQACSDAMDWPDNIRIAINISAVQFEKPNFLFDAVITALKQTGLSPYRLELEITESVLLHENDNAFSILRLLQEKGVRIVLDDFGTGYSSLSYLRSFSFNKLKLDRSFIHELSDSEESQAILRAVAGLGQSFAMETTAEGVENEWQLERVQLEGFSQVQGFLYGKPLPAEKTLDLFQCQNDDKTD